MEQLIRERWKDATRVVESVAVKQGLPHSDWDDLTQDTLFQLLRNPPKGGDSVRYLMGCVRRQAFQKIYERRGLKKGHQANRVLVEANTYSVGLYHPTNGDDGLMDERILPFMASAEDVFFASLPSKRQEALRGAIDELPEDQRTALTLATYEELTVPTIAVRMGRTQAEVKNLLAAGRLRLKRQLNPKGTHE